MLTLDIKDNLNRETVKISINGYFPLSLLNCLQILNGSFKFYLYFCLLLLMDHVMRKII